MADNIRRVVSGKMRNLTLIRRLYRMRKRMWESDGIPAVDAGSQATYPVKKGDLAFDYTNNKIYVCSVAPTAEANATFVEITQGA